MVMYVVGFGAFVGFGAWLRLVFAPLTYCYHRWTQWRDYVSRSYPKCWWFNSRDLIMTGRGQDEYIIHEPACVYALPPFLCTHSSHDRYVHYRARFHCSVLNERTYPTVWCLRSLACTFLPLQGNGCKVQWLLWVSSGVWYGTIHCNHTS